MFSLVSTYYSPAQFYGLLTGFMLALFSVILFRNGKTRLAVILLFVSAMSLRWVMIHLCPFLNAWDEQYHALVAKNMMDDPFRPLLQTLPLPGYDPANWTANHVWLHKPPLFLWLSALSMKLFGVSEIAFRLPGVIMLSMVTLFIYRIGRILVSAPAAFYAAFFYTLSSFMLHVATGEINTDQNDIHFMFFVTGAAWCWVEYLRSGKLIFVIGIGLFSGSAVMVKWLPGLIVLLTWGLVQLFFFRFRSDRKKWKHFLLALFLSVSAALPWHLWCIYQFPVEYKAASLNHLLHITQALDGHDGGPLFYYHALENQFFSFVPLALAAGFILVLRERISPETRFTLFMLVLFPVLVYSFVIQTKMPLFLLPVYPFLFLSAGLLADKVFSFLERWWKKALCRWLITLSLAAVIYPLMYDRKFEFEHTDHDRTIHYRKSRKELRLAAERARLILPGNTLVFHTGRYNSAMFRFYSGLDAYDHYPTREQYTLLKKAGYRMAMYEIGDIPDYLKYDKEILWLGWRGYAL